jgi:hypothetical protein
MAARLVLKGQHMRAGWIGGGMLLLGLGACARQAAKETVNAPAPSVAREAGAPLAFAAPQGWISETPASSMRKAQYRVPKSEGDAEDAECVVYYFGAGGGGGLDANIERWCSQFEQPDGRDSRAVLVTSERQVAGMPVHEVELGGTYVAETAPGSGVRVNKPGFAMRGAIIESDHGAYYAKLVGPAATVAKQADAFRGLVDSAH